MNGRDAVLCLAQDRRRTLNRVTKFVRRADSEDLIQEAYLRLLQSHSDIEQPLHYLYTTIRRLAWEQKQKNKQASFDTRDLYRDVPDVKDEILEEEFVESLDRKLAGASPKCRRIFEMHALEGYTYDEIADTHGVSPSMVKKYLFLAKRRLKND